MSRLSKALGGPGLWIKRDDCTGLATGGNKTRKLEFLMAAALEANADIVVTQGAVQSNHVRQTAAAACKLGLDCYALLERRVPGRGEDYEQTGNVFFDQMFNTQIEFRPPGLDMNDEARQAAEKLQSQGRKPYFIPGGGSNETGASCLIGTRLLHQFGENGLGPKLIVLSTGSAGTHAGMVCSFTPLIATCRSWALVCVSRKIQITCLQAGCQNGCPADRQAMSRDKVLVDDGYVGEGYGIPTDGTLAAINTVARNEGILLDPVYSGKGMAGLIGQIENGQISGDGEVVFLHTGGAVSLFAYEDQFLAG